MPGGRPKKPTELKKLEGTYRKDRDSENTDVIIKHTSMILDVTKVSVPKSITNAEVRKYYTKLTKGLLSIGVLSGADLPQLEQMCIILQKLKEAQKQFVDASVFDEEFDLIEKRYLRLVEKFDTLSAKYYVSPVARSKIRLDELAIQEKEISVEEKKSSAVSRLLQNRNRDSEE